MSIYEIVLFILVGFIIIFCVLMFISINLINKQVERIVQKVIKSSTKWVYFEINNKFEIGYFTHHDIWICIHKVDTEKKAMTLVNYLNGGKNND